MRHYLSGLFIAFSSGLGILALCGQPLHAEISIQEKPRDTQRCELYHVRDHVFKMTPDCLNKYSEFLVHSAAMTQKGAPNTVSETALGGLVLTNIILEFYHKADSNYVVAYESGKGQTPSHQNKRSIMARLPVKSDDDQWVSFDLSPLLEQADFSSQSWTSDFQGKEVAGTRMAQEVRHSVIDADTVKKTDQGLLWFDQQAEAIIHNHPHVKIPLTLRYFFEPYRSNPNFKSKFASQFKEVGFFETPPQMDEKHGRSFTYITKWQKPVVFHLSADIPTEYHEVITKAILYWNSFGREMVSVAGVAPEGVRGPHPEYNLINWLDWTTNQNSFAYGPMMFDPRTGEIRHGMVFIPTIFADGAKFLTARNLRTMKIESAPDSLGGLANLEETLQSDDAALTRATEAYIAATVAHEVGHNLGLRHNFAGHLGNQFSPVELKSAFETFLREGQIEGDQIPLSSVMHYAGFSQDILAGAKILANTKTFDYDRQAIEWGYFSSWEEHSQTETPRPSYCPESLALVYKDCGPHKVYANPFFDQINSLQNKLEMLPAKLVQIFMDAKAPFHSSEKIPLHAVDLRTQAQVTANDLAVGLASTVSWLNPNVKSLSVNNKHRDELLNDFDGSLERHLTREWVTEQIFEAGGVRNVFFRLLSSIPAGVHQMYLQDDELRHKRDGFFWTTAPNPSDVLFFVDTTSESEPEPDTIEFLPNGWPAMLIVKFEKLLAQDETKVFRGIDDQLHNFSNEEIKLIRKRGRQFIIDTSKEFMKVSLQLFATQKVSLERGSLRYPASTPLEDEFVSELAKLADEIIFATNPEAFLKGSIKYAAGGEPSIIVPALMFDQETRLNAAKLLKADLGSDQAVWAKDERTSFGKKMQAFISKSLGLPYSKIDVDDMSRPLQAWYKEQLELLQILELTKALN